MRQNNHVLRYEETRIRNEESSSRETFCLEAQRSGVESVVGKEAGIVF